MDEDELSFGSAEEAAAYWKDLANVYKQSLEDCREELDEFQTSSRELEAELEAQLENAEGKLKELTSSTQRQQMEIEMLRSKLEKQQAHSHSRMSELEDELAQYKGFKEELQKYIRELEQTNDDLERAKRSTVVSLEDFEGRLNQAIERNAFLESELEERETLSVTVQRLKDEARDLRSELAVRPTPKHQPLEMQPRKFKTEPPLPPKSIDNDRMDNEHLDSNRLADAEFVTPPATPAKIINHSGTGTPITPSARISALNIVGDLLRKVGALESKLASCRNFVKDQPRPNNKTGSSSPLNSPRAKRIHRGMGASGIPQPGSASQQGYPNVKIAV